MITCEAKFRDKSGKIVGYRLFDQESMQMQDIEAYVLKSQIASGNIKVANLQLTSDGRLVDCNIYGKPDTEQKIKLERYRNGRLRATEFVDANLSESELQKKINVYDDRYDTKLSKVTVSNVKPVKEFKVVEMKADGSYKPSGIISLMNVMRKRHN